MLKFMSGACAAALMATTAHATNILFVGNSFTYGEPAGGPMPYVKDYNPGTVVDLNGTGIGGVPALFKEFTVEAGLTYAVSLETAGGIGLDWHYNNRLGLIAQPWDQVVLQSYSTLDASHPGDPTTLIKYSGLLASALSAKNPAVDIHLDATWSRADQTYLPSGHWYGQPIDAMEKDVQAGYQAAKQSAPLIDDVIPVGAAWNLAFTDGFADPNPYDGITPGQVDLWAPEGYHASNLGYYLEALMEFGDITKLTPSSLGGQEAAAAALNITPNQAIALQAIATQELTIDAPEPASLALLAGALGGMALLRRRHARG